MSAAGDQARRARPGRREDPIDEDSPPHRREFARRLRELRNDCGAPAYAALAELSQRSQSRLSDAARGHQFPTWDIARAYVRACLLHSERPAEEIERALAGWKEIWQKAKDQETAIPVHSTSAPASTDLGTVTDEDPRAGGVTERRTTDTPTVDNPELKPVGQPDSAALPAPTAGADQIEDPEQSSRTAQRQLSPSNTDQVRAARDGHDEATEISSQRRTVLTRRNLVFGLAATAVGFGGGAITVRELWPEGPQQPIDPKQPIRVTSSYLWDPQDDYLYAVPGPLSPAQEKRVMQVSHPDEWAWLAREANAVRFGDTPSPDGPQFSCLDVSLQNVLSESVLVTRIRASVLRRSAPLAGALVVAEAEGETDVVPIGFDLDNITDTDARVLEDFELGMRYTDLEKIVLAPGEIVPLRVMGQTKSYYCEWIIEFRVQVAGKLAPVIAPQNGDTFKSTAFADQYATIYERDICSWKVRRIPGLNGSGAVEDTSPDMAMDNHYYRLDPRAQPCDGNANERSNASCRDQWQIRSWSAEPGMARFAVGGA